MVQCLLQARVVSTPPILEARGVTETYRMGEVDAVALRGVDIELRDGELVVLLGGAEVIVHPSERVKDGIAVRGR